LKSVPVAVIDTNIVVSGLITSNPESSLAAILDGMLNGRLQFVLSTALLDEYREVLQRPKLRKLHALQEHEIEKILEGISRNATWIEPTPSPLASPDPDDQHLWDLLTARPDAVLVTGDHLLFVNPPPGTIVQLPREFLENSLGTEP